MIRDLFKTLSLATLCSFMLAFASCANEDVAQKKTDTDNDNNKNLTTFTTGTEPETRTSMDYATGNFFWEAGDYIYVQDDDNVWQKSSNAPTTKVAAFKFKVPGKFAAKTTYKVYYPGKNRSNNQVTILPTQIQKTPNTTTHFGVSGDCGTADATKITGKKQFEFKLDHRAAYLVFQPYTSNTVLKDCFLTKIEVTSDNFITGTYTLDPTTGELTGTGTGKQIVLWTKEWYDLSQKGFPLTNTTASLSTNGTYMVIKPGTHTLRVRYWIKDYATNVEGTITKTLSSFNYVKNTYYDMTADLNVRDYSGHYYCMWDAKKNYWYGHEWDSADPWQPTLNGTSNPNYPKSETADPDRFFHQEGVSGRFDATQSCANLLNANEMAWYAMKGEPCWDADELWTTMGHLYKGGMWIKKKSAIQAQWGNYSTEHAPNGIDLRTTAGSEIVIIPSQALPDAGDASKYFYLPALGGYSNGGLGNIGERGYYWSSSTDPGNHGNAYSLSFHNTYIMLSRSIAYSGYIAQPFSDFGDN